MKKTAYLAVVAMTICWTLGLAALAPVAQAATALTPGDLIKASSPSVYYYGADARRYVFPDLKTYQSWYGNDFSTIKKITDAELAVINIGGNVTYRPGVKMVKINTDPTVYAISKGGTFRKISSEAVAACIFGSNWGSLVNDISDAFFVNYKMGAEITNCSSYNKDAELASAPTINADKSLLPAPTEIVQCSDMDCLINLSRSCQPGEVAYNYVGPIPLFQMEGLIFDVTTNYTIIGKDSNDSCILTEEPMGGIIRLTDEERLNLFNSGMTSVEIDEALAAMNDSINSTDVLNSVTTCAGTSENMSIYLTNEKEGTTSMSCEIGTEQSTCTYEPNITCVTI